MYQIFVAEDELLIRQSIRRTIETMKGPYALCGEAADGEIALSMMQDLMPDILLTDIRMPFLDGFGLIRNVRERMPWLKIVIISGYGDFDLAQKAISLGVDEYLLKPVRPAELTAAIEKMAAQLEKSKEEVRLSGHQEVQWQDALRRQFTQQLLYGGENTESLLENARQLGLDIVKPRFLVSVHYLDTQDLDHALVQNVMRRVTEGTPRTLYCFHSENQFSLLVSGQDDEAVSDRTYQLIQILRHEFREVCPVITTVVGRTVQRLGEVSAAYREAARLLQQVSGISAGQVINMADAARVTAELVQFTGPLGDDFLQKLACAGEEEVPGLVDGLLSSPEGEKYHSALTRNYALVEAMKWAVSVSGRRAQDLWEERKADGAAPVDLFEASADVEAFRNGMIQVLSRALSAQEGRRQDSAAAPLIRRAEQYLRENCCDPNISLIGAARYVGLSPAHFSTVFSQTMGHPFIAHLTQLRIEKAKDLLAHTDKRLSDIAMDVGYNEPNYFSHVFRKQEGITPKEYRAAHQKP